MRIRSFVLLGCLLFSSEVKAVVLSFPPSHYCFNLYEFIQKKSQNFCLRLLQTRFSLFRFPFFKSLLCVEPTISCFSTLNSVLNIEKKIKSKEVQNLFFFGIKIKSELLKIFSGRVKGYFIYSFFLFTLKIFFIKKWGNKKNCFGPWERCTGWFFHLKKVFDRYKKEKHSNFLAFLHAIFQGCFFSFEFNIYSRLYFLFQINFLSIKEFTLRYKEIADMRNSNMPSDQYELKKYDCIKGLIKNLLEGFFSFEIKIFDGDLYSFVSE